MAASEYKAGGDREESARFAPQLTAANAPPRDLSNMTPKELGELHKASAYLGREESVFGRVVNSFVDLGRGLLGKPSLRVQAWDLERAEEKKTESQSIETVPQVAAVEDPPRDFSNMISTALEASGLDARSQLQALAMIDNAAVYLHQADPSNRLGRTATPGSISAEWNQLGLTEGQAGEMIGKAIENTKDRSLRADQVAERLAVEMTRAAGPERTEAVEQSRERETPALAIGGR